MKKPLSVKQLLLWGFLLTTLLPLLIVMWLAFYQARSVLREEITRDMQTRATAALSEVDNMMFERLQNVVSWSGFDVMSEVRSNDKNKLLASFLSEVKSNYRNIYEAIYVVNTKGVIVASSNAAQKNQTLASSEKWTQIKFAGQVLQLGKINTDTPTPGIALEGSSNRANLNQDKISQYNAPQVLPIVTDILDENNRKIGELHALFYWENVLNILHNTENQHSAAALLDEHNNEIAYTDDWRKIIAAHDVAVTSNPEKLNKKPIFNWHVTIAQYRSVVMQPVKRMGYIFLVLLGLTAFYTTILAALFSRQITTPLAKLTEYANSFIRSSQNVLPAVDGPHEIRVMSKALGKMMDDLAQSKVNLTRAAKLAVAGEMAAAMSHEVRTPLGILRSSAQVLSREKNLSTEGLEVTQFITTETDRLNKLVSTLVDSARPRQPEFAMHDIVSLVEHAMAMLRMQANKKDISLILSSDQLNSKQLFVECDDEQITQVILNLVLNAIQILPAGGNIVVSIFETADNVTVSVADDGAGIDEAQKEHIFDPFFTQRPGGIGLGLAVSRQIVTAHFGKLTVDKNTVINSGADFRVNLPKFQIHT